MVNYLHASGRIKVLESTLLPRARFEQMLSMDAKSILDSLKDTVYGGVVSGRKPEEYNRMYRDMVLSHYKLIKELDESILAPFYIEHDLFNIKQILKLKLGIISGAELFSDLGSIDRTLFDAALKLDVKEIEKIFPKFKDVISEALKAWEGKDEYMFESVFDKASLEMAYEEANPLLKGPMQIRIDGANIRLLIRSHAAGKDIRFLEKNIASYGKIGAEITGFFGKSPEVIMDAFKMKFRPVLKLTDMDEFEKDVDELFISAVRKSGMDIFTAGPMISYLVMRLNEARNIRAILLGKLSNLDEQSIRKTLRF